MSLLLAGLELAVEADRRAGSASSNPRFTDLSLSARDYVTKWQYACQHLEFYGDTRFTAETCKVNLRTLRLKFHRWLKANRDWRALLDGRTFGVQRPSKAKAKAK